MAPPPSHDEASLECVIVGGGISGVCMAAQLLSSGITSFVVLEKSGEIGGTWASNRYPGCRCDVPSHLYCFSFHPSPHWTQSYAPRAEIHSYLRHCAKDLQLLPYFRFQTTLISASWEEATANWKLSVLKTTATAQSTASILSSRFLIRATGPGLHFPRLPSVPGVSDNTFAGPSFHSSQWDPDHIDVTDKTVAVIGTGASAIQIIPAIAPFAKQLVVCQRTPAWVVPVLDISVPPSIRRFFRHFPYLLTLLRYFLYWIHELLFASQFFGFLLPYVGVVFGWASRRMLHQSVADPSIRAALTPSYPVGCKRVLLSNVYYDTFTRPNVRLLSGRLTEVRRESIVVTEHASQEAVEAEVDVIVYATGFDTCAPTFEVLGRGGVRLSEAGEETMLGIVKHGFPNFFMMLGPNTSLGHNSVVLMAEAQAKYIALCVAMRAEAEAAARKGGRGWRTMEVKLEAQKKFQKLLDSKFPKTVWKAGNCSSWYVHPVTGRNHVIWPASTLEYFRRTNSVSVSDYHFTS